MEEIERRIISDRLERCHWNQTEAAEYFKIPLSTLNQKIKRLNVEVKKRGARLASRLNDDLHRVGLGVRRQLDRRDSILQREAVRDQVASDRIRCDSRSKTICVDIFLNGHRRAVRTHQGLLVHADGGRVERRLSVLGLGEEHHASARTDRIHREFDQRVAADCEQSHVSAAAFGGGFR